MIGKRKYIIGIAIFIFIGLTIFSFANQQSNEDPVDSDNTNNSVQEGQNNNQNKEDNKKDDKPVNNTGNNNANNGNTVAPVLKDDSYEEALTAVIKAEEDLTDVSYDNALNLVDKVTSITKKETLSKRLLDVRNVIDVQNLVNELSLKVKSAKNKEELDLARDYRTLNDIVNKVNKLTNESVKKQLQKELESLALLLDDTMVPSVNIEDGAIFSTQPTIVVTDHNEVVIKLKKDDGEFNTISNNYLVEEQGAYELIITDAAFNEITVKFIVDLESPVINILDNSYFKEDVNVIITDLTFDNVEIIKNNEQPITNVESTFALTEEGSYKLVVSDKVGHTTTVNFVIDKTAPVITLKKYNAEGENTVITPGIHDYSVIAEIDEINIDTIKLNTTEYIPETEIKNGGSYTLVVTDKAGNTTTIEFVIDTESPIVKINDNEFKGLVENIVYYNSSITPIITEANLDNITLNGNAYEVGTEITEEGSYTLLAKDKLGHTTTVSFVIDKTAPTIVVDNTSVEVETDIYSKLNLQLNDNVGIILLEINGRRLQYQGQSISIIDGDNYTFFDGVNIITVTDKAGNTLTESFIIDRAIRVQTFAELKNAFATGGKVKVLNDIVLDEILYLNNGEELLLDMNGKKFTVKDSSIDPMFEVRHKYKNKKDPITGEDVIDPTTNRVIKELDKKSKLIITGNGTFDLEDNSNASFFLPFGDITIMNGSFIKNRNSNASTSAFVGINGGIGELIIYGGYFDSGYYVAGDDFNNSRTLLNASWGQKIRVYGGTFVGQNPAWGDEGMAYANPNNPNRNSITPENPNGTGYCQGVFLEGQHWQDLEIPSIYTITEGVLDDGRPTYKVNYNSNN